MRVPLPIADEDISPIYLLGVGVDSIPLSGEETLVYLQIRLPHLSLRSLFLLGQTIAFAYNIPTIRRDRKEEGDNRNDRYGREPNDGFQFGCTCRRQLLELSLFRQWSTLSKETTSPLGDKNHSPFGTQRKRSRIRS